jgi:hypothetical protein
MLTIEKKEKKKDAKSQSKTVKTVKIFNQVEADKDCLSKITKD